MVKTQEKKKKKGQFVKDSKLNKKKKNQITTESETQNSTTKIKTL